MSMTEHWIHRTQWSVLMGTPMNEPLSKNGLRLLSVTVCKRLPQKWCQSSMEYWMNFCQNDLWSFTLLSKIECHCVEMRALHACHRNCKAFSVICKTLMCDMFEENLYEMLEWRWANEDRMLSSDKTPICSSFCCLHRSTNSTTSGIQSLNYSAEHLLQQPNQIQPNHPNQPNQQIAKSQLEICQSIRGWGNVPVQRPIWVWRIPPCSLTLRDLPGGAFKACDGPSCLFFAGGKVRLWYTGFNFRMLFSYVDLDSWN